MQFSIKHIALLIITLMLSSPTWAEETLATILSTATQQTSSIIDYREVRHLQLLTTPWQGTGRIFITKEKFAIVQQSPDRIQLVANQRRYWFFLPQRNIHRSGSTKSSMATGKLGWFKPIIRGDREAIEKNYDVRVSTTDKGWQLDLEPKQTTSARYSHITVKGEIGATSNYILTQMADGDHTEWFFQSHPFNHFADQALTKLIKETRGY
ncbi:MAG: hypothetical protein Q9M31_10440 [Mariprofundus sp.]|nr:hypothetical protein [Mariprofundus sp.]